MNLHFPVFTTENICHDCYKCIRHCPCKAIRIVDGRAGVIQELCVACGMCVKVCPAHAKKIRPRPGACALSARQREKGLCVGWRRRS